MRNLSVMGMPNGCICCTLREDLRPEETMRQKLQSALLTEHELANGETSWLTYEYPFPSWSSATDFQ